MNNIYLVSVALFASLPISAIAAGHFYLGGQLGAGFVNINKRVIANVSGTTSVNNSNVDTSDSTVAGAYLGYDIRHQNAGLAVEVGGAYQSVNSDQTRRYQFPVGFIANVNEKININFDLSVLPQVYFGRYAMLFARLGLAEAKFHSTASDAGNIGTSGYVTEWLPGYVFGGGFQLQLQKHIAVRMEYDNITYWDFSKNSLSPGFSGGGMPAALINTRYTITNHQVLLGITYDIT